MTTTPAAQLAAVIQDYRVNVEPFFLAGQTDGGAYAVDQWVGRWGEAAVRAALAVLEVQFELKKTGRR
ncbi:hypothetical protein [Streptomyces sp. STR69]|uniref:hypothetical protein n=1 Tax=Streptomyces sp. STR69 TaxID=1796942 RepID=UPI0021C837D2|nr:hypothetical protein [Streptomyces sp. STR69]